MISELSFSVGYSGGKNDLNISTVTNRDGKLKDIRLGE